jgi:hypothetical protein
MPESPVLDLLMVADGERIALGALIGLLINRKSFPQAQVHLAVPEDAPLQQAIPARILDRIRPLVYTIPAPTLKVEGHLYRILNKVQALASFGPRPVLLCDSDTFFLRALPLEYFAGRTVPAAAPEHGRHDFPWERLYPMVAAPMPSFRVLCGSGEASLPWLNAGMVFAPNAAQLGDVWLDLCRRVQPLEWVPERFPYLDQITLPLAIASLSPRAAITPASVLDGRLNQNLFHWMPDQSYVNQGFGVHHHHRSSLIRRYCPDLLTWVGSDEPLLAELLSLYSRYDDRG